MEVHLKGRWVLGQAPKVYAIMTCDLRKKKGLPFWSRNHQESSTAPRKRTLCFLAGCIVWHELIQGPVGVFELMV